MRVSLLKRLVRALAFGVALIAACGDGDPSTTGISGGSAYPETIDGTYSATIVTLTDEGSLEVDAGTIRVVPAREWFFRRDAWAQFEA